MPLAAAGSINLGFALYHIAYRRELAGGEPGAAAAKTAMNAVLIYGFALYGGLLVYGALSGLPILPSVLWAGLAFWALRALLQPALMSLTDRRSLALFAVCAIAALAHFAAARATDVPPERVWPRDKFVPAHQRAPRAAAIPA